MNEISEFPIEVINEIKYYVYRLIDPRNGETFYVGKGKGNRVFQHIKCAIAEDELDEINEKYQTIRQIVSIGLNVIHVIHRHGMDEQTSLEVEAAIIDAYPNATNIAGGTGSNDYGPMNAKEIVEKYASQEAEFKHKVLMIVINKSNTQKSMYNATRFAWKVDKEKAEQAEYVLAVVQGMIRGVFIANNWKDASINNFPEMNEDCPDRYAFVGVEANQSIKELYVGKRVPTEYRKKGASNPIKYNYKKTA